MIISLQSPTGGRVTTILTQLPSVGPGALKSREDPNDRAGKVYLCSGIGTEQRRCLCLPCFCSACYSLIKSGRYQSIISCTKSKNPSICH